AAISIVAERWTASASTSDHHPMPITATRSLRTPAGFGFDSVMMRCRGDLVVARLFALRAPDRVDKKRHTFSPSHSASNLLQGPGRPQGAPLKSLLRRPSKMLRRAPAI